MKNNLQNWIPGMGWLVLGAVPVQILAIALGFAAPDFANYLIILGTAAVAVGLLVFTRGTRREKSATHGDLVAAIDLLFAHFDGDEPAREAVRTVARAITERRYKIANERGTE